MTFRKEDGKIILEFEDQAEFEDLIELAVIGNCKYRYNLGTRPEVKERMQKITDELEKFCDQL